MFITLLVTTLLFLCLDEWALVEHIKIHTGQARYFYSVFSKDCNIPLESNKLNSSEKSIQEKIKVSHKFYNCNVSCEFPIMYISYDIYFCSSAVKATTI